MTSPSADERKQEGEQALHLRAEIKGLLLSIVEGTVDLESQAVAALKEAIDVHRRVAEQLKTCSGTLDELAAIAKQLRDIRLPPRSSTAPRD